MYYNERKPLEHNLQVLKVLLTMQKRRRHWHHCGPVSQTWFKVNLSLIRGLLLPELLLKSIHVFGKNIIALNSAFHIKINTCSKLLYILSLTPIKIVINSTNLTPYIILTTFTYSSAIVFTPHLQSLPSIQTPYTTSHSLLLTHGPPPSSYPDLIPLTTNYQTLPHRLQVRRDKLV